MRPESYDGPEFEPYGNKLQIVCDEKEEQSAGGIFIPGQSQEAPCTGTVIACGLGTINMMAPTNERIPTLSKPGDRIVFYRHAVHKIKIKGEEISIISESDVEGRLSSE